MNRGRLFAICLTVVLLAGVGLFFLKPVPLKAASVNKQIIVKLLPTGSLSLILSKFKLTLVDQILDKREFLLEAPLLTDINLLMPLIRILPGVEDVGPNVLIWPHRSPRGYPGDRPVVFGNEAYAFQSQQLTTFFQVDELHSLSQGAGVKVAVLDTGVDATHPVLAGHIAVNGYDYVDNDKTPIDAPGGKDFGHGTFVSGLVLLMAPQAEVLPVRVLRPDGSGDAFHVAAGIYYAAEQGANIINLSLGTDRDAGILRRSVLFAQNAGCLVTAAMGNEDLNADDVYPAAYPNVIAVAATDFNDGKASFSNFGPVVDLAAPGVGVVSAYPQGRYAQWSGTSFATPLVSAEAALLFAQGKSREEVLTYINSSVVSTALANSVPLGRGRIDPLAALSQR